MNTWGWDIRERERRERRRRRILQVIAWTAAILGSLFIWTVAFMATLWVLGQWD